MSQSKYKELLHKMNEFEDGQRCGKEFIKLCERWPNLALNIANFQLLMDYFLPDHLLFDASAGREAIQNDEKLRQSLAWLTDKEVEEDKKKAIKDQNAAMQAKPVTVLRSEIKQAFKKRLESFKRRVPPEITRQAFLKATRAQRKEWVERYGFDLLNEAWAKQESQ